MKLTRASMVAKHIAPDELMRFIGTCVVVAHPERAEPLVCDLAKQSKRELRQALNAWRKKEAE
ncbi:MAG: hypothetical protein WAN65_21025 [Candidatus Sulfotelmatobacter sp.]